MKERPKNCPRCGSIELSWGYSTPPSVGTVTCHAEGCHANITAETEEEAISLWNSGVWLYRLNGRDDNEIPSEPEQRRSRPENVSLCWSVKKGEKAPLMCRLFGHLWSSGWRGDIPYLKANNLPGRLDGTGRRHVDLRCECDRCGKSAIIAQFHNQEIIPRPLT